jgi:hypothetical protein
MRNKTKILYKYKVYHLDPDDALIIIESDPVKAMLEAKKKWPWQDLNIELIGNMGEEKSNEISRRKNR